jgi:hypothetical protein
MANEETRLDKHVLFHNIGSIFVCWYSKELSSWYLAKPRCQVDVYLISIWCLEVEKLRSKSDKIDDYNKSIWKVLSGQETDCETFINLQILTFPLNFFANLDFFKLTTCAFMHMVDFYLYLFKQRYQGHI